jgi:uroporphyrinogen-III decarboxylase
VDGLDYGTQRSEMFSAEVFRRHYLPYYDAINGWIHRNTSWKTWKHTCGSVPRFIPLLIESGLDALNPVQTSARGMSPGELKGEFGEAITFWGGGVDTQHTLPFGTPEEVYAEVEARIKTFAPGGGFVFAAVHNVQADVPPENIVAMFRALRDHGRYPMADSRPTQEETGGHR